MSELNIPTAEQFEVTIANLTNIATALGSKIDTSTWEGVRQAVRAGVAPQLFPVGTQFLVSHSVYGDMLYDVVAHDYLKSVKDETAHTMTLQCHDVIQSIQLDNPEAFYSADTNLPAGTYNFTIATSNSSWVAGTYQITLRQNLPVGGQLVINGYPSQSLTTLSVNVYASSNTTTITESVPITSGNGGTSLGTLGVELNHASRCAYGSNNYKESAVRQFLNSSSVAGEVWSAQTKFDRPPYWLTSRQGFMRGLSSDFLNVIGEVSVPCSANKLFESTDSSIAVGSKYTVNDRFYIVSMKELKGTILNAVDDDSVKLPYYKEAIRTDYVKYRSGTVVNWRTRTPSSNGTSGVWSITSVGQTSTYGATDEYGIAPMCTIV